MPTPAEEAFAAEVEALLAQVGELDEAAVRRAAEIVEDIRAQVASALAAVDPDSFTAAQLVGVRAQVTAALATLGERVGLELDQLLGEGAALGYELGGVGFEAAAVPERLLEILQGYSARLITGLTDVGQRRIDAVLARATLGAITPYQAIQQITGALPSRSVFNSLASRAEAIVRTEVNRAVSAATQSRMTEVAQSAPGLKKRWIAVLDSRVRASHAAASGQVVGANERFTVGGYGALYPRDPALPAKETVQCRCQVVPVIDAELLAELTTP